MALITTWTEVTGDVMSAQTTTNDYGGRINDRTDIKASLLSTNATEIRIKLEANSASNTVITAASFGVRAGATEDYDGAPTALAFSGSPSVIIPNGTQLWTDWFDFTLDSTKDHLLHIWRTGESPTIRATLITGSTGTYYGAAADTTDQSMTQDWTADGQYAARMGWVVQIEYKTPNVWQAALTTEPSTVWFDFAEGTNVASIVACNGDKEWFWASNVLYVYSTSDPDTAYTSPGISTHPPPGGGSLHMGMGLGLT